MTNQPATTAWLRRAFAYFNEVLFGGELAEPELRVEPLPRQVGGYCRTTDDAKAIVLNASVTCPAFAALYLVHEMVHLWQGGGQVGHDAEWCRKAASIGLHPEIYDDDGKVCETIAVHQGPFDRARKAFLETDDAKASPFTPIYTAHPSANHGCT